MAKENENKRAILKIELGKSRKQGQQPKICPSRNWLSQFFFPCQSLEKNDRTKNGCGWPSKTKI